MLLDELDIQWQPNGEQSLSLILHATKNTQNCQLIPVLTQYLAKNLREKIDVSVDIIPCQDSITLYSTDYQHVLLMKQQLELILYELTASDLTETLESQSQTHDIAICYDDRLATDLSEVATQLSLSKDEIIERHVNAAYRLDMLGFLPGFFYLSGLDMELSLSRKATPSISVPRGSVAIAESMSGIYSLASPGGWWVIGRTPDRLFDVNQEPPVSISPLDTIRFRPIDYEEFMETNHD